jgi:hypothetical protein
MATDPAMATLHQDLGGRDDEAKLFTDIATRLAPAAPAAQDTQVLLQMQKAQCDAQLSSTVTALEMQKLAAHLEQEVEAITAWLEEAGSVERMHCHYAVPGSAQEGTPSGLPCASSEHERSSVNCDPKWRGLGSTGHLPSS